MRGVIFFLVANFCVAWSDLLAFKVTKVKTELIAEGFDMQIDFQMEETFENWLFGFYMPTRFIYAPSLNINPNLSIVIYDQNEPSIEQAMQYLIKNQDNAFVYGNGTISAFQTNDPFSLKKGHAYTVSFTNSNQAAPFNVSTVAQSFSSLIKRQAVSLTMTLPLPPMGITSTRWKILEDMTMGLLK